MEQKDIQKRLTNQFRKKAQPHILISQSKPIRINGKKYHVVGQYTIKSTMLTFFDVYDETGVRANDKNGQTIFKNISRLQIAEQLLQLAFLNSNHPTIQNHDIPEDIQTILHNSTQLDITQFIQYGPFIQDSWSMLRQATEHIAELEQWDIEDFRSFDNAWKIFWETNESYLKQLFQFRELVVQHKLLETIKFSALGELYETVDFMYQLFTRTIAVEKPIMTDINDLIQLNYRLGRTEEQTIEPPIITKFEQMSNRLFKSTFRLLLWFLLPISCLLVLLDIETLKFPIVSLMFVFLAYYIYLMDSNAMKANVATRFKEQRKKQLPQQKLIQTTYEQSYATYIAQQEVKQKTEQIDTFSTFLARPMRWFIGTSIVIMIIGWGIYSADTDSSEYGRGYFVVGLFMFALTLISPYWPIMKRTFKLRHDVLQIGKRIHKVDMIHYIEVNKKGSIIKVLTTQVQQAMVFKVNKEFRKEAVDQLKHWCKVYDVHFKQKK